MSRRPTPNHQIGLDSPACERVVVAYAGIRVEIWWRENTLDALREAWVIEGSRRIKRPKPPFRGGDLVDLEVVGSSAYCVDVVEYK